ncbi:MAG: ATP-binding protein [Kofleriaceae bacterium]
MRVKGYGLRSIVIRIMAVALLAAFASGAIATYVGWREMSDTAEVKLVEATTADVDRARAAIIGRLDVAEAQLTAAALLANSDRIQEAPIALSDFICGTRVVGTKETLELVRHEEVRALLPQEDTDRRGRRLVGDHVVIRVEAGEAIAVGVVEIVSLFPSGEGVTTVTDTSEETRDVVGVMLTRGADTAEARSSLGRGLVLLHRVSLAPARAEARSQVRQAAGWTAGVTLVIVLLSAWVLARWVTRPIRRLVNAVTQARERFVLPPLAHDEIGELGVAIESMHRAIAHDAHQLTVGAELAHAVVRIQDPAEVLAALGLALDTAHPALRWQVHTRDVADEAVEAAHAAHGENAQIVRVFDGDVGVGVAIGIGEATQAERRSVEVMCHTAFAAIKAIELLRAASINDKLALIGRMSAGVAHEINNPLAFVALNLGMLEEQLTGERQELVRETIMGVDRVAHIVRDLSQLSRSAPAELEREDLVSIVQEQIKIARARLGRVTLVFEPSEPVFVACARARVGQAVLNLIMNAIDAVSNIPDGRVEIAVTSTGDRAELLVRDNGPGIPDHARAHLFDAFFSTKGESGTGLGLYLSRKFIEMQNGTLELASSGPTGTTFRIGLAVAEDGVVMNVAAARGTGSTRRRVLVIDDEPQITRTLERWLSKYVDVVTANGGREGIEKFEQQTFSLVLCDWNMPGVAGSDFIAKVKEIRPKSLARVVIMTGGVAEIEGVRVLQKPLDRDVLKELLGV